MELTLSPAAAGVLAGLEAAGFRAWVVGGCVRDALRGESPHDWDVCTDARPEQVAACFARTLPTGLVHGTVTVLWEHTPVEVTTLRAESGYSDGRRPDHVEFVTDLNQDLARRDFTVNAMAWNPRTGLADPFDGRADLAAGVLRAVGQPEARFAEDALRILRGLRFAARLGFAIDPATARAMERQAPRLRAIAPERVQAELDGLVLGAAAEEVLARWPAVLEPVLPEIAPAVGFDQHNHHHCLDVWGHTARAVGSAAADRAVRLTMLLHDLGKPDCFSRGPDGVGHFYGHAQYSAELAQTILTRLRYDNDTRDRVVRLVRLHDAPLPVEEKTARRLLNRLGERDARALIAVHRADTLALAPAWHDRLAELDALETLLDEQLAQDACFSLRQLAVNGRDVLAAGAAPGPAVGRALDALLQRVLAGEIPNDRAVLLAELKNLIQ